MTTSLAVIWILWMPPDVATLLPPYPVAAFKRQLDCEAERVVRQSQQKTYHGLVWTCLPDTINLFAPALPRAK